MRNEDFKKLVSLLEGDPGLLHNLIMEGASSPKLEELLSERGKAYAANVSKDMKLANALLRDEVARASRLDAIAACVDSCEASRLGAVDERWAWYTGGCDVSTDCPMTDCSCTNAGTCTTTCNVTQQSDYWRRPALAAAGCDANQTCSCTSGTCGGATCGGSTCSATCTGDSCGSTCGDSCGWTSNISRRFGQDWRSPQVNRWR